MWLLIHFFYYVEKNITPSGEGGDMATYECVAKISAQCVLLIFSDGPLANIFLEYPLNLAFYADYNPSNVVYNENKRFYYIPTGNYFTSGFDNDYYYFVSCRNDSKCSKFKLVIEFIFKHSMWRNFEYLTRKRLIEKPVGCSESKVQNSTKNWALTFNWYNFEF